MSSSWRRVRGPIASWRSTMRRATAWGSGSDPPAPRPPSADDAGDRGPATSPGPAPSADEGRGLSPEAPARDSASLNALRAADSRSASAGIRSRPGPHRSPGPPRPAGPRRSAWAPRCRAWP
ncbi:hypothetical protein [Ornithinimicrobium kibberense]|uniref:hypothetical protein n=1 Tax=Ornithinimicrobium kibberense TaxID=282060 RepID=UPI003621543D